MTCKAIGLNVLNYGAPIWASTISNRKWNRLQTQQNIALAQILAEQNAKISDINDVHNEGEMLPVKSHTEVLAEQFLAGRCQSHRTDLKTTSSTSFCPMRPTLNATYSDRAKQHTNNKEHLNRK